MLMHFCQINDSSEDTVDSIDISLQTIHPRGPASEQE
jgi:hypothetical protein